MWREWQNNTKILSIGSEKMKTKNIYCSVCSKYRKFKKPKISYIFEKYWFSFSVALKMKRYSKNKNKLRY